MLEEIQETGGMIETKTAGNIKNEDGPPRRGPVVKTLLPLWGAGEFVGNRTYDPRLGN